MVIWNSRQIKIFFIVQIYVLEIKIVFKEKKNQNRAKRATRLALFV